MLPLVDGGPRKLVHGVFGTLMQQGATLPDLPTLPPPLDLTLREPTPIDGVSLLTDPFAHDERHAVSQLPGYAEGQWWVQDLAASLPARLIGKCAGRTLDLCVAPGGKTLQLACARTGLSARIVTTDLLAWQPDFTADAVLLDAPCSATGIFRRHSRRVPPRVVAEMA